MLNGTSFHKVIDHLRYTCMVDSTLSSPILILSGVLGDTRRYRTLHLHQQLRLAGVDSTLSHTTDPHLPAQVRRAAVVVLHRVTYDPYVAGLINGVHARQGLVLVDADDLVFDLQAFRWIDSPDFQDPVRASLYQADMLRYRQTIEACDGVITSTAYLAQAAAALGKPCWVHRNAANLEMIYRSELACRRHRPDDGKVVIGYASGTPTHNRDFSLVSPALQSVLQDHPDAELRIIGHLELDPSWDAFGGRLRRYPALPWRALPAWLAELDINLAPLVLDNPFSQSKSEIKYMEAALVGVPTLASPTDAFTATIRPGENGLLAASAQEWRAQLEQLMSPGLRQALGQAAYADAYSSYAPQVRAAQAVALLNQASAELKRPYCWQANFAESANMQQLWWDESLERHPTLPEMGLYTLRFRGAGTLARQVWIFFRRWLARYIPYSRGEPK